MYSFYVASILTISSVYSADYCAWNRAAKPINENNLETYNWINGEYNRDETQSSGGQTALWQGMPYYKSTNPDVCPPNTLWMYRYTDIQVYPPENTWVISTTLGTLPIDGYAYCGPNEVSNTDLSSPILCNGKWKVGKPLGLQATDIFFTVMPGGCPQVNCNQIRFCTNNNEEWGSDEELDGGYTCTTYDYYNNQPNFYRASSTNSLSGYYYLFFNPNVWKWAFSEEITGELDPDECELYKSGKGFTAVANVNGGDYSDPDVYTPWYQTAPTDGVPFIWNDDVTTLATRTLICLGMYLAI